MLGGYSKEDGSVELTPVAQNYDSRACGGSLTSMVNRLAGALLTDLFWIHHSVPCMNM